MRPAIFPLLLPLLFFLGCALAPPGAGPLSPEEHLDRAAKRIRVRDYAGAAGEVEQALRQRPSDARLYLRLGDLLEAQGRDRKARKTFTRGLQTLPAGADGRIEIAYRLALLESLKLDRPEAARNLLPLLPDGSPQQQDLLGVLTLKKGLNREALILFNRILENPLDKETGARILHHAALAYQALGDDDNASKALYNAINYTENLALIQDIEMLWQKLKAGETKAP